MKFPSFVAIPYPIYHVKFLLDRPTVGLAIGRAVGQPGPKTAKIVSFSVFQPLHPRTLPHPNKIQTISSHTIATHVQFKPEQLSGGRAIGRNMGQPASFLASYLILKSPSINETRGIHIRQFISHLIWA